ncbi:MAG: TonB-dependent receptor [Nitrospirae bacterium]|nr:TonB-dependent receptor [Nitrospirota bacterium]
MTVVAARSPADLSNLTIEELANIEITSVSKKPEPLSDAAAAVYVITREDIRRSGATSIPEILRLAPNLEVARVNSNQYAISARGFNSTTANKLLVLIDGRTVYTPLYSGVFWDVQDVLIEDIERIEVVSGPGGTLWGSNAVNGVINIITRHSRDTTGAFAGVGAGIEDRLDIGARYGGRLGEHLTYRLYAKGFERDDTETGGGASVQDSWNKGQAGFRTDWTGVTDTLTLQGDLYDGSIDQMVNGDKTISGANVLGRWSRTLHGGSVIEVQTYYDRTRRFYPGTFGEILNTYDIQAQHRFSLGARHDIVWGGGYRLMRDDVTNSAVLAFLPASRVLNLFNIFLQDGIALGARVQLTLGLKLENNRYTRLEVQPNIRLAWKPADHMLLWSAVSRAVRTPSRLDRDLFAPASTPFFLAGGPNFDSETLIAYEAGYRVQPITRATVSISAFYNVYDKLRSLEPAPGGPPPYVLDNKMKGHTYGVETWGSYSVTDWWRLSAGYTYLKMRLHLLSGSGDPTGVPGAGNDPTHQASARSMINLPYNLEFDLAVRAVGNLPAPAVPSYVALDARLGWIVWRGAEISVMGSNLLDRRHPEFGAAPARSELERTVYGRVRWTF